MIAAINCGLLAKLFAKAGHPGTPDNEAVTAARKAYNHVDRAGTDFDAVLKTASAPRASQRELELLEKIDRLQRELSAERQHHWRAAEKVNERDRQITEINSKLRKVQREKNDLKAQVKRLQHLDDAVSVLRDENAKLKAEIREVTKANRQHAAKIEALQAENAALKARKSVSENAETVRASTRPHENGPTSRAKQPSEPAGATQHTVVDAVVDFSVRGFIAALNVLRKVDPDMRIKTALAYLHTATSPGLTISEVTGNLGQASVASVRYAMRSLGLGWPGKRDGLGLIQECASADGGRARLYIASAQGLQMLNNIGAALRTVSARQTEVPDLKLAA